MSLLVSGRVAGFVILILSFIAFYLMMKQAQQEGYSVKARTFAPVAAIPEAVGRAAEMGRPIYTTSGYGGGTLNHARDGPQTVAGITIMRYVARLCAEMGVDVYYYTCIADSLPLVDETFRTAYLEAGKPEAWDPERIRYQAGQSPYVTASLGFFQRQRPAATVMMGCFYYESVVLGAGADAVGAMQISGCAKASQLPFLIATCDYVLLGEELFAAGAEISGDVEQLAILRAEDWLKLGIIALLIIGSILATTGSNAVINLFKV
jgi:hypothetical protein